MGRFRHAAFAQIKDKGQWDQKENGQSISEKKKGKRPDGVHGHTLGNKSGAPDEDGCYKGKGAPEFVFHNHITAWYFTIFFKKLQADCIFPEVWYNGKNDKGER